MHIMRRGNIKIYSLQTEKSIVQLIFSSIKAGKLCIYQVYSKARLEEPRSSGASQV
jgi:hypothetical protein